MSLIHSLPRDTFTHNQHIDYLLPDPLVARLESFSKLEELSISFNTPGIPPSPRNGRDLLEETEAGVTLPLLKRFTFQGGSAYLDRLLSQIRTPLLKQLNIMLFNQLHYALSHLTRFTNTTERHIIPIAKIIFKHDAVSIFRDHRMQQPDEPLNLSLHVTY